MPRAGAAAAVVTAVAMSVAAGQAPQALASGGGRSWAMVASAPAVSSFSPHSAPARTVVTVSGGGFGAFEGADVYFDTTYAALAAASAHGYFAPITPHLLATRRAGAVTTTVTVSADQPGFTDTGVMLEQGQSFTISATGKAKWTPTSPSVGPNGYLFSRGRCGHDQYHPYKAPSYLAPGLNCWSLVGRIGSSGVIFPVGTSLSMPSPSAGELYLGFNDDYYPNNSGAFVATITTAPDGSHRSLP